MSLMGVLIGFDRSTPKHSSNFQRFEEEQQQQQSGSNLRKKQQQHSQQQPVVVMEEALMLDDVEWRTSEAGVSAKKLVLGVPFYGYAWRLVNANDNGIFAPANGAALSNATAYSEIKDFIAKNSATTVYNSTFVTNYCYSGTTWIGYDDTNSTSTKVTYAKGKGLLGYFAWQLQVHGELRI
ncbi:hypothetical protein SO802_000638 [Lithocarpus litseifolius]|uniref:GH18 domain-containing protein n=1 Tax=Lithocarpus litseifolius TaxID=425828 RepID=A0AAW2DVV5_9ROSI